MKNFVLKWATRLATKKEVHHEPLEKHYLVASPLKL